MKQPVTRIESGIYKDADGHYYLRASINGRRTWRKMSTNQKNDALKEAQELKRLRRRAQLGLCADPLIPNALPSTYPKDNMSPLKAFRIWSNQKGMWWGWNRNGYASFKSTAGRYTFEEARMICVEANAYQRDNAIPDECMVPLDPDEFIQDRRREHEATPTGVDKDKN